MVAVTVIGAGVIGLTAAHSLLDAGFNVEIIADRLPPDTTSNVAAAFWLPYKAFPIDKVKLWSHATYRYLMDNLDEYPGVSKFRLRVLHSSTDFPWWSDLVDNLKIYETDLPDSYELASEFDCILMESNSYLSGLVGSFKSKGGHLNIKSVQGFNEIESDLIVNCTGLGAKDLVGDDHLFPVRGQVLAVSKKSYDQNFGWVDENLQASPLCIIPRSHDVVVGVTVEENNENLMISSYETKDIIRRVQQVVPGISENNIEGIKVGLRPGRESVRLDQQLVDGKNIIHCYGHGGAGFTLSWGCAQQIVELAKTKQKNFD